MKNKRNIWFLIVLIILVTFTACGGPQGDLYSKTQVKKTVKENVPTEKYKLISVEPVLDAEVSTEIYTFESKERDLTFQAINTRRPVMFNAGIYGKSLEVKYTDAVCEYYEDEIGHIIENSSLKIDGKGIGIDSFDDLESAAQTLMQLNDMYKEERKYNTEKWIHNNPVASYCLTTKCIEKDGKENKAEICYVPINGEWDYDLMYDFFCYSYASCIKEGVFDDATVPADVYKKGHITTIKKIYINDIDIVESGYGKAFANNLINNDEHSYYAGYCYQLGDYVIPISVAVTSEEYAPKMTEEILDTLGIGYEAAYESGRITWIYNGDKFEINAKQEKDGDREISDFKVLKNGRDLNIPYVTYRDWTSHVRGTYMIGIAAHDLAELFDLSLSVDENSGEIRFE